MNAETRQRISWWFALLGGALAWLFHLLTTYAIGEFLCVLDARLAAAILLSGATMLALAVTLWSACIAWKCRERFICYVGLIADGIFLLVILAQTVPIFLLLEGC